MQSSKKDVEKLVEGDKEANDEINEVDENDNDDHNDHALIRKKKTGSLEEEHHYQDGHHEAFSYFALCAFHTSEQSMRKLHDDHLDNDVLPERENKVKKKRILEDPSLLRVRHHQFQLVALDEMMLVEELTQQVLKKPTLVYQGFERDPNAPAMYLYNKDLFYLRHGNTNAGKYVLLSHKIYTTSFLIDDHEELLTRWVGRVFKRFKEEARLTIQH
uniref:Uncharacterized protein n=1 Tax=Tanacetum cinerariifolium TaxID=118510 RepID=A0A699KGA2_TANCI|nr:hypothetical protein [Tanacetum cinerariifolium]